ncbi:MAG TPA: hypothetical protein VKR53_00485, partial [Puia sp.]|nr:hypothetical protein [Puia sp.]
PSHIFQVFRVVNLSVIDTAFLLSCIFIGMRRSNPGYIRVFVLFGIANYISDASQVYYLDLFDPLLRNAKLFYFLTQSIHFAYPLFEFFFFTGVLFQLIRSALSKTIARLLGILFLVTYGVAVYLFFAKNQSGFLYCVSTAFFFKDSTFLCLSLFFFIEIFKDAKQMDIARFPAFWIVTGIVFYYSIDLLTIFFASYFYLRNMLLLKDVVLSISYFPAIVVFILFTKAFLCRIRQ